jgi:4-amino-4-deoxy-L-arabinose transferase-like glycosyltransferase
MSFIEERRYNKVGLLLFLLIVSYILTASPFILSIYTSFIFRYLLFLIIIIFSFLMIFKKKKNLVFLIFLAFFVFQFLYYISFGANFGESYTNLMSFSLAIILLLFVKRSPSLKELLINFYFGIVLLFSILSIVSFITFNLDLAPFKLKAVGEGLDVYWSYHNYILGYVSIRNYEMGDIGRICGFMVSVYKFISCFQISKK